MGKYLRPYREAVRDFGTGFEALLWNSEEMQRLRFEAIVGTLNLEGRAIADMGCGRADLLAFLVERGISYGRYVGVEAIDELRGFSQQRAQKHGWKHASFVQGDFVEDQTLCGRLVRQYGTDTFIFSGSLNTLGESLARRALHTAWTSLDQVREGVLAFNFLSDRHRARARASGPAKRFDTLSMIRWAFDRTPVVAVRHDVLGDHDCLIVMRRG